MTVAAAATAAALMPPSGARIMAHCAALAQLSEDGDAALTRVFLSPEHRAANDLVRGWMREAGMTARIDAIGNVVGRYEGRAPGMACLMLGSHLDTVRNAGRYDGMLGVVAAVECVRALAEKGVRLPFAIEVIGFADEEGVRFGATLLGSRAVAGTFDPRVLDERDRDGVSMHDALVAFGLDPESIGKAARRRSEILAYAELHIEQGPVLEAHGLAVGNVTAIKGAHRLMAELRGNAGHAGTVPMSLRQDALAAAAECVLAIEACARQSPDLVATVGMVEVKPGATNVIPGEARFAIDVRSAQDADRIAAVTRIRAAIGRIAAARRVAVSIAQVHESPSVACGDWLQAQIRGAIAAEGHRVLDLPSGAGHDGMALAAIADIGMIFVRCSGGVSHSPLEAITAEDAAAGARVLLRFIEGFRLRAG
jgi:allantoate deiminase